MATRLFGEHQQWELDNGLPNNGGKIYFYEPGTTTLKSVYTTSSLAVAHTNPVILDANGRPTNPIWLDGEYKYKVTTSADVAVGLTIDNLNADTAAATVETGLLVANGSFETDTGDDGTPDSWTLVPLTSATIATDTTDSAHGTNSLKFTSGGNGGGTATSARFDVEKSKPVVIAFTYKASAVDVKTLVDVKTYDKDGVIVSTLSAYSEAAANPATYTEYVVAVDADATAVTAEVVITGIDATSTTKTAGTTTNFDNVRAYTKQGGIALETIFDDNGNELKTYTTTASAVNYLAEANAATGNDPTITASGSDSNVGENHVMKGTGTFQVDGIPVHRSVLGTPIATTSGTTADFTSIPSWVKKITVSYHGISTNGTSDIELRIGDSGGIEATGYTQAGALIQNAANPEMYVTTTGFSLNVVTLAAGLTYGVATLTLVDSSNFIWSCSSNGYITSAASVHISGGTKSLSAALDRVQITSVSADTFDAGTVNILYEG